MRPILNTFNTNVTMVIGLIMLLGFSSCEPFGETEYVPCGECTPVKVGESKTYSLAVPYNANPNSVQFVTQRNGTVKIAMLDETKNQVLTFDMKGTTLANQKNYSVPESYGDLRSFAFCSEDSLIYCISTDYNDSTNFDKDFIWYDLYLFDSSGYTRLAEIEDHLDIPLKYYAHKSYNKDSVDIGRVESLDILPRTPIQYSHGNVYYSILSFEPFANLTQPKSFSGEFNLFSRKGKKHQVFHNEAYYQPGRNINYLDAWRQPLGKDSILFSFQASPEIFIYDRRKDLVVADLTAESCALDLDSPPDSDRLSEKDLHARLEIGSYGPVVMLSDSIFVRLVSLPCIRKPDRESGNGFTFPKDDTNMLEVFLLKDNKLKLICTSTERFGLSYPALIRSDQPNKIHFLNLHETISNKKYIVKPTKSDLYNLYFTSFDIQMNHPL